MGTIEQLEGMLSRGRDDALLRFSLGAEHLKNSAHEDAVIHLQRAVEFDPDYSAAWKLLGKGLAACGRDAEALEAWRAGIAAAERRGDKQAAKEMSVFARRIEKRKSP